MKSYRRPLSPCPLGTSCPGQLVALIPRVHLLLGWMACTANPRGHMLFSIFALRITLKGILSLLSCGFAFPAFISSPLFPDGGFLCLLWDLETGALPGGVVLSLPALYLRGTGGAGVMQSLIIKRFIPGWSKVPTSGTERYTLAPEACNFRSV